MIPDANSKLSKDQSALLDAAEKGDVSKIERLLAAGVNANVKDDRSIPWDVTPLMRAARGEHLPVVRALLAAGADVKARDKHVPGEPAGRTALHYAAARRNAAIARLLVEARADINAIGTGGTGTPLSCVISGDEGGLPGKPQPTHRELKEGKAKSGAAKAEYESMIETVRYLVSAGADPNRLTRDGRGSVFLSAASDGFKEIVGILLDGGADINLQDSTKYSALMSASVLKKIDVAMLLLERGAEVNLKGDSDFTALHRAAIANDSKLIEAMLKRGAKLNERTDEGQTPLDIAIRDRCRKAIAYLQERGARRGKDT